MKEKEEDEENKIRKFAHRQSSKQSLNSNTEATLILWGSSGERANTNFSPQLAPLLQPSELPFLQFLVKLNINLIFGVISSQLLLSSLYQEPVPSSSPG